MKKLNLQTQRLFSDDQARLCRLSEEIGARLFEASLIIARITRQDQKTVKVVIGSSELIEKLAASEGIKLDSKRRGKDPYSFIDYCDKNFCCISLDWGQILQYYIPAFRLRRFSTRLIDRLMLDALTPGYRAISAPNIFDHHNFYPPRKAGYLCSQPN